MSRPTPGETPHPLDPPRMHTLPCSPSPLASYLAPPLPHRGSDGGKRHTASIRSAQERAGQRARLGGDGGHEGPQRGVGRDEVLQPQQHEGRQAGGRQACSRPHGHDHSHHPPPAPGAGGLRGHEGQGRLLQGGVREGEQAPQGPRPLVRRQLRCWQAGGCPLHGRRGLC